ncbi:MAG: hypothetical protein R2789_08535 [Microthrixaceae bacterium]
MVNGEMHQGLRVLSGRHQASGSTRPWRTAADRRAVQRIRAALRRCHHGHRDDLADEGTQARSPPPSGPSAIGVPTPAWKFISDCRSRAEALELIFAERPDVLNHNIETVARLQRAVRPSAGYARSLSVLARSVAAGLVTKSGLVLGMGETARRSTPRSPTWRPVGVSIVTIGQYLDRRVIIFRCRTGGHRRTSGIRPGGGVLRWLGHVGRRRSRSSYHAAEAMESLEPARSPRSADSDPTGTRVG